MSIQSAASMAAHRWLNRNEALPGATISIVDGGMACARRTGVAHHLADAAEIAVGDETTLAARWLCGGSSVDAVIVTDASVDCVSCRLTAATPQGPCVYFAWGRDDELLYVGSSVKVAQRIRSHTTQTRWWPSVRRLTFVQYATEFEARRAELESIAERPGKHNREGVRKPQSDRSLSVLDLVSGAS